jgi:hypothetical protein
MNYETETLDDRPVPELAADLGWQGLVAGDYKYAVIRLATVALARVNYLLWAGVELFPSEIRTPPDDGVLMNCGDARVLVSRTSMPVQEALTWYEQAWQGAATVPRKPISVLTGSLGPEPSGRWFVLRDDLPFSPAWHLVPRTHRLVPMDELPDILSEMVRGMATTPRFQRAREWLEAQLHFDILAHDDWVGGIALVAPNPIQRACNIRIVDRGPSHETIEFHGKPRVGVSVAGVEAVFQERRAGGAGWRASVQLDRFGAARTTVPGQIDALGTQIVCPRRGLLHEDLPASFFRSFTILGAETVRTRESQPPRRRRSDPIPKPLNTPVREPLPVSASSLPVDPLRRLRLLQEDRDNRFGVYRPLRVRTAPEDIMVFGGDRAEAVSFIQRQVARARYRVLFLDPYFEPADLLEFAYATEQRGVAINALFAPRLTFLRGRVETAPEDVSSNGAWLERAMNRMAVPDEGFGPIDIRVMRQRRFHDRFLQVDDTLWHCGHSFNSVGSGEISVMSRVARPQELITVIEAAFEDAEPFPAFWARESAATQTRQNLAVRIASVLRQAATYLESMGQGQVRIEDDA